MARCQQKIRLLLKSDVEWITRRERVGNMLLKCTADGRRIKVNGAPVGQGNVARGGYCPS
ncbi:hypothetical protein RR46_03659 [Papilio xuthus]|uniref:Uncharacterized protein n=1 Tax=Papilio xuthus TaxID=66420 RepID=A0A194PYU5_PAPXU|nr:hypothetical protein RR46_03659 [Papilio xuthus]